MTAAWVVNALVVSGFCVAGAALLEWTLRERLSSHTRWLWVTAMVASVSLPFLGPWLSEVITPLHLPRDLSVSHWIPAVDLGVNVGTIAESQPGAGWIGSLWAVLSLGAGLTLVTTVLAIRRQVRGWRSGSVAGVPVRYTKDFGPAVVGIRPARIVLPEWARHMDTRRRRLLLIHEGEHARAGDVALLHAGFVLLVVMPWNPLLWWSFRRLRLSLELDCDRRVLRAGASLRHYAEMLVDLPLPRAARPMLAAVAFAPIRSHLGRRIDMITRPRSSLRGPMLPALAGSLAALLFVLACDAAVTDPPASPSTPSASAARARQEQVQVAAAMGSMLPLLASTEESSPLTKGTLDARAREERVKVAAAMGSTLRLPASTEQGSSSKVLLRASTDQGPLVVVDGKAWTAESLSVLDPKSIASVEIAKGPAAVARYGEAAINGVVLITRLEASRKP